MMKKISLLLVVFLLVSVSLSASSVCTHNQRHKIHFFDQTIEIDDWSITVELFYVPEKGEDQKCNETDVSVAHPVQPFAYLETEFSRSKKFRLNCIYTNNWSKERMRIKIFNKGKATSEERASLNSGDRRTDVDTNFIFTDGELYIEILNKARDVVHTVDITTVDPHSLELLAPTISPLSVAHPSSLKLDLYNEDVAVKNSLTVSRTSGGGVVKTFSTGTIAAVKESLLSYLYITDLSFTGTRCDKKDGVILENITATEFSKTFSANGVYDLYLKAKVISLSELSENVEFAIDTQAPNTPEINAPSLNLSSNLKDINLGNDKSYQYIDNDHFPTEFSLTYGWNEVEDKEKDGYFSTPTDEMGYRTKKTEYPSEQKSIDGNLIFTTSKEEGSLGVGEKYTFDVSAVDLATNASAYSPPLQVRMPVQFKKLIAKAENAPNYLVEKNGKFYFQYNIYLDNFSQGDEGVKFFSKYKILPYRNNDISNKHESLSEFSLFDEKEITLRTGTSSSMSIEGLFFDESMKKYYYPFLIDAKENAHHAVYYKVLTEYDYNYKGTSNPVSTLTDNSNYSTLPNQLLADYAAKLEVATDLFYIHSDGTIYKPESGETTLKTIFSVKNMRSEIFIDSSSATEKVKISLVDPIKGFSPIMRIEEFADENNPEDDTFRISLDQKIQGAPVSFPEPENLFSQDKEGTPYLCELNLSSPQVLEFILRIYETNDNGFENGDAYSFGGSMANPIRLSYYDSTKGVLFPKIIKTTPGRPVSIKVTTNPFWDWSYDANFDIDACLYINPELLKGATPLTRIEIGANGFNIAGATEFSDMDTTFEFTYDAFGTNPIEIKFYNGFGIVDDYTTQSEITVSNTQFGKIKGNENWVGTCSILDKVEIPVGMEIDIASNGVDCFIPVKNETASLWVDGKLTFSGTASFVKPILPTVKWGGIYISETGNLEVAPSVQVDTNPVTINGAIRGLTIVSNLTPLNIHGVSFQGNDIGLHLFSSVKVWDCIFEGNRLYGIKEDKVMDVPLSDTVFSKNKIDYYDKESTSVEIKEIN